MTLTDLTNNVVSKLKKFWKRESIEYLFLVSVFIIGFVLFFHRFFLSHEYISAADFLYLWFPWAKYRPEGFSGVQNFIVSDWVDSSIPSFHYIKEATLELIVDGFKIGANWGHPNSGIIGAINLHEPLQLISIKLFGPILGSTLLFLSKILLAFSGMFFLLREYKVYNYIIIIFSAAFAFSIPMISPIYGGSTVGTVLIPFIFLSAIKLSSRFKVLNIAIYISLIIWLITTGFPSTIMYVTILVFLYFILEVLSKDTLTKSSKVRITVYFIFVNIIVLGLWSWSLLPNIVNLQSMDLGYREGYGVRRLSMTHLMQLIYPNYCGNGTTIGWICDGNWIESSMSSGILSIMLLLLSLPVIFLKKNKQRVVIIFYLFCSLLLISLIFNWFGISNLTSKLPLFSIIPNTRLTFILPFFITITGALLFNRLFYDIRTSDKRAYVYLGWGITFFVVCLLLFLNSNSIKNHLLLLPKEVLIYDFKHLVFIGIPGLGAALMAIFFKKSLLNKFFLVVLFFLTVFDLYYYNSQFLPFQKKEHIFPTTEGIRFLQDKMGGEDRIITVGRVFLPNTNEYYGINALTGHDWRTASFTEAMQPIQPGIFQGAGTLEFFDRERIILTQDVANYLRFNRVKYIIQSPDDLKPQYDIAFVQPHINGYFNTDEQLIYTIDFDRNETLKYIDIFGKCDLLKTESLNDQDLDIVIDRNDVAVPITVDSVFEDCGSNKVQIVTNETEIMSGDSLEIWINNSKSWLFGFYSNGDIRRETLGVGPGSDYELSVRVYSENPETFPTVYSGDMLISEVSDESSSAYFLKCEGMKEEVCKTFVKSFRIDNPTNLEQFNVWYESLIELPIIAYSRGKVKIDTSSVDGPGVVIISDNYFQGWFSSNGDPFKGFLGTLNVYMDSGSQILDLNYTNEYLLLGFGISMISLGALIIFLVWINRAKITNP